VIHYRLSLQGEDEVSLQLPLLLMAFLERGPEFIPAAAKGNITPGLFRAQRRLCSFIGKPCDKMVIRAPSKCLRLLFMYHLRDDRGLPEHANEAGLIPILGELLKMGDELARVDVLALADIILLTPPFGHTASVAPGFMRAIAGLITAKRPVALTYALDELFALGVVRRELIMDFNTWDVAGVVERLAQNSDADIAHAAQRVLFLVNDGREVGFTH
jgi:hypothetical protein